MYESGKSEQSKRSKQGVAVILLLLMVAGCLATLFAPCGNGKGCAGPHCALSSANAASPRASADGDDEVLERKHATREGPKEDKLSKEERRERTPKEDKRSLPKEERAPKEEKKSVSKEGKKNTPMPEEDKKSVPKEERPLKEERIGEHKGGAKGAAKALDKDVNQAQAAEKGVAESADMGGEKPTTVGSS